MLFARSRPVPRPLLRWAARLVDLQDTQYLGLSPEVADLRLFRTVCVLMTLLGRASFDIIKGGPDRSMNHDRLDLVHCQ